MMMVMPAAHHRALISRIVFSVVMTFLYPLVWVLPFMTWFRCVMMIQNVVIAVALFFVFRVARWLCGACLFSMLLLTLIVTRRIMRDMMMMMMMMMMRRIDTGYVMSA